MEREKTFERKLQKANEAFEKGDILNAIKFAEEARRVNPTPWLNAEYLLIDCYENTANYQAAINLLLDMLPKAPDIHRRISWLKWLGCEYSMLQTPEAEKGIECFTSAIALMEGEVKKDPQFCLPTFCSMYVFRSNLYRRFGQKELADADLQEAVTLNAKYMAKYVMPVCQLSPSFVKNFSRVPNCN